MAPRSLPLPPLEQILAEAPNHTSLAKLGEALGFKGGSFQKRVKADGTKKQIVAALASHKLEPRVEETEEEVSREEILEHRVKELEALERKDRKNRVYDERITTAVENAIATRQPIYSPAPIARSKQSKTKHEFALLWSDLHAGEVVSLEETNGINSYDWQTMMRRHDRIKESLFSYQDNRSFPVEKLHIWMLGDFLSGNIHDELVATNEIPLAEALVQLAIDGAEWVESLTERFSQIHLSGIVGNHPRAHKKPWAKQGYDNADWSCYRIMEAILRNNKRITFDIPKANQHPVEIVGRGVLLFHGDQIRSSMPGVPWGGVMRRVNSFATQYARWSPRIDHYACGHFHQFAAVEGGRVLLNGNIKGVDEYSLKAFGGGVSPQQTLTTFHPRNGLTDVSLLDCEAPQ